MKTKEFIKRVKELGYRCYEYADSIAIRVNIYEFMIAAIDKKEMYSFIIGSDLGLDNPETFITDKLLELIVEYVRTPVDERVEEKKFYLRHKWLNLDTDNYLHLDVDDGSCMLDDKEEFSYTKIKLTKKEIKEIKEKFNTDLADFELVEVEE